MMVLSRQSKECVLITEIVHFDLPKGISRADVLAKYRQTAPAWSRNEDLVQKYYFFDEAKILGGGVYVWKTMDAARRYHCDEYKARKGLQRRAIARYGLGAVSF